MRYARTDLGVRIDINLDDLRLFGATRCHRHFALGTLWYPADGDLPEMTGYLLYFKPSVTGDEDEIVNEYRVESPDFPTSPPRIRCLRRGPVRGVPRARLPPRQRGLRVARRRGARGRRDRSLVSRPFRLPGGREEGSVARSQGFTLLVGATFTAYIRARTRVARVRAAIMAARSGGSRF